MNNNYAITKELKRIERKLNYLRYEEDKYCTVRNDLERFNEEYPKATVEQTQGFLAWCYHSELNYNEKISKIGL